MQWQARECARRRECRRARVQIRRIHVCLADARTESLCPRTRLVPVPGGEQLQGAAGTARALVHAGGDEAARRCGGPGWVVVAVRRRGGSRGGC
eukprot:4738208-Prymnesium_polylepis.1